MTTNCGQELFKRLKGYVQSGGDLRLRAALLSGRCLLDLGELKEAYRVFQFVAAERPDDADAHRGLAAITYDLGRLGEAVEHLRRVAELDAAGPRPHRLIGLIYKDMGQDALAESAYREALRRGPLGAPRNCAATSSGSPPSPRRR